MQTPLSPPSSKNTASNPTSTPLPKELISPNTLKTLEIISQYRFSPGYTQSPPTEKLTKGGKTVLRALGSIKKSKKLKINSSSPQSIESTEQTPSNQLISSRSPDSLILMSNRSDSTPSTTTDTDPRTPDSLIPVTQEKTESVAMPILVPKRAKRKGPLLTSPAVTYPQVRTPPSLLPSRKTSLDKRTQPTSFDPYDQLRNKGKLFLQ